ncbi:MAG: hypothetical protein AAGG75_15320 [Bacteroidota bacterium]
MVKGSIHPIKYWLLASFVLWIAGTVIAQEEHVSYHYKGGTVIVKFDHVQDSAQLDDLLQTIGSSKAITDSLQGLKRKRLTPSGWELVAYDQDKIEYRKKLRDLSSDSKSSFFLTEREDYDKIQAYNLDVKYGVNRFREPSVVHQGNNVYTFKLLDYPNARQVYLSGTFNNWSTLGQPMQRGEEGWEASIPLTKGKHLYKFIVDGSWIIDPANAYTERDRNGHTNNVFFNYNYNFRLRGFPQAEEVYLAGSFNAWQSDELQLNKVADGWELPLYLEPMIHTYKFIVDDQWMTDPHNPNTRPDGFGNENSLLSFGNQYTFQLKGYPEAQHVVLSGDFNNWNGAELIMEKQADGWALPIALRPGNYQYKFIIDGRWTVDPDNPYRNGRQNLENAVRAVEPNHTFFLPGHTDAKEVLLTGTFNGWSEQGYTMRPTADGWTIDLYLPKGKTRYKFIIDGKWQRDKDNPLWEKNQFDTEDSVLWMK